MNSKQMNLFESSRFEGNGSAFHDPAFTENRNIPIHRWVPWIAGYSAQFIDDVILAFGPSLGLGARPPLVLDPFAGVGTTLVQAMMRGYRTVGFEINPYATLASHVKVQSPWIDVGELNRLITRFRESAVSWHSKRVEPSMRPPQEFRSRIPFFSPPVERKVLVALDLINSIERPMLRDVFRLAMGSVMVSFSNYSYEPSLGTRPASGKSLIEDADVAGILLAKLRHMKADIQWIQSQFDGHIPPHEQRVFNEDFLTKANSRLSPDSVDIVITSPPYMNNYHYVRNSRPQLYWLSLVTDRRDTQALEEANFGKFWQTVRSRPSVELEFASPSLVKKIEELRATRVEKGAYGGLGWANYVAAYIKDCARFLSVLHRVLRPNGMGIVIIGNSIIQGIEFKVDDILGEMATEEGFRLEDLRRIRDKRVGASITQSTVRRGRQNGAALYESALILRKQSRRREKTRSRTF